MFPGLFLIEFAGYWEDEPENGCTAYINPNQVTNVRPFARDKQGVVTLYIIYICDCEHGFIVPSEELNLVSTHTTEELTVAAN